MTHSEGLKRSWPYRWRLPITAVCVLAGWGASLFTPVVILENTEADRWLDSFGWLTLAMGIGLRAWASREISGRKRLCVVDRGPYALCRNPLYLGTFLIGLSQFWFLRTFAYLVAMLAPVAVYVWGVVPAEERVLGDSLSAEYAAYCTRTPRWWPRWNVNVWKWSPVQDAAAWERESLSLLVWLLLPFLSEFACYLRELPDWPHAHWLM